MFKWEIKKIVFSKIFIVSIVLIIGVRLYDVFSRWNRSEEFRKTNGLFEELYLNEDEYNNRAIPYYQKIKNVDAMLLLDKEGVYLETAYADMHEIKALVEAKKYSEMSYEASMVDLIKRATRAVDTESSQYEIRYYTKYIDTYNQRVAIEPTNNVDEYLEIIFTGNSISFITMVVWVSVLTTYVVKGQEKKRLRSMYMTTANGRRIGIFVKLGALGIVLVVFELLCFVALIINAMTMYGFSFRVLTAPIQSSQDYMYCPIHTSIMGIILIRYLTKILVLLMVMNMVAVGAYFVKSIPSAVGGIIIWGLPVFLISRLDRSDYDVNELFHIIRQYYPSSIYDYSEYVKTFDYCRMLNFPVSRLACVMVITVLLIVACVVFLYIFAEKKNMEMGYGIKHQRN